MHAELRAAIPAGATVALVGRQGGKSVSSPMLGEERQATRLGG